MRRLLDLFLDPKASKQPITIGGWFVLAVMVALMTATIWYAAVIWNSIAAQMSGTGWGMLIAGVVISMLLGGVLSALVIYSSRNDYDR